MNRCQVRGRSSHHGLVRPATLEADSQPPGKGTATLIVRVNICEAHRETYFDGGWQISNIKVTPR